MPSADTSRAESLEESMRRSLGKLVGLGFALSLAAMPLALASSSAQAGDGGAVAAGLLGGLAVGTIAGSAIASAAARPPPPVYYAPYAPVYAAPPPRCWIEPQQVWDGYGYVIQRVRVCQ
jgi:hypothetical protein